MSSFEQQVSELVKVQLVPLSKEVARLEAENCLLRSFLRESGRDVTTLLRAARASTPEPPRSALRQQCTPGPSGSAAPANAEEGTGTAISHEVPGLPVGNSSEDIPRRLLGSRDTAAEGLSSRRDRRRVSIKVPDGDGDGEQPDPSTAMVELLPLWKEMDIGSLVQRRITQRGKTAPVQAQQGSFLLAGTQNLEKLIAPPTSQWRILWEALGAICIIYDLVTVPLQAFRMIEYNDALEQCRTVMIYLHISYWTLDVPLNFFVGYYVNGVLETRARMTAKKYLTSWFLVDICLVTCDWIMFFFDESRRADSNSFSYLVYGRILRLLRFVRLVRLLKLHNFFNNLMESIHSEYMLTFMRVSEHVMLIVVLNHFIACAWYWIGTLGTGESWVSKAFGEVHSLRYRYFTSLHWSLTQFTPASMEVVPTNAGERAYNVCVVILAMVIFSTFISSITEAMTRLRKLNGRKAAQYQALRQYLGENQVSMQLAMRVWRYIEQGAKARRRRRMSCDVELLRELPDMLQMDLHHEVYMPTIIGHPFFHYFSEQSPAAMRAICHFAAHEVSVMADQVLFSEGQAADKMYFVLAGAMEYQVEGDEAGEQRMDRIKSYDVTNLQWISEAAIWVRWFYRGTTVCKELSSLVSLRVPILHQIMQEYVGALPFCLAYAQRFAEQSRSRPSEMLDIEEDVDRTHELAQQAFEFVESLNKPEGACPPRAPPTRGKRRVTWRRQTLGSTRSGRTGRPRTFRSGSNKSLSSILHMLRGGSGAGGSSENCSPAGSSTNVDSGACTPTSPCPASSSRRPSVELSSVAVQQLAPNVSI